MLPLCYLLPLSPIFLPEYCNTSSMWLRQRLNSGFVQLAVWALSPKRRTRILSADKALLNGSCVRGRADGSFRFGHHP